MLPGERHCRIEADDRKLSRDVQNGPDNLFPNVRLQKVELRRVEVGRDFGPTIEIIEGISLGDQVILNPADSLVSGGTVRLAEPARPAESK